MISRMCQKTLKRLNNTFIIIAFLSYRIFTTSYNYRIESNDKINIANGARALYIWLEFRCLSFMPVQVIAQSCNLFLKKRHS